jgi:hypothetical protein
VSTQSTINTRLYGSWLIAARIVWFAVALLTIGAFVAGLPATFALLRAGCAAEFGTCAPGVLDPELVRQLESAGVSMDMYATSYLVFTVVTTLVWWATAGVIFWRKSDDWMALLAALMLVLQGATSVTEVLWSSDTLFHVLNSLSWIALAWVFYLFPDGRFVPRWMGWFALGFTVLIVQSEYFPELLPDWLIAGPGGIVWFGFLGSILFAQVYRYRRVSGLVQRQQTKWVVFGVTAYLLGIVALVLPYLVVPAVDQPDSLYGLVVGIAVPVFHLLVPLSIGIAILRARLWDIDVIINRTLVYSTLTAALALIYISSVVLLQQLLSPFTAGSELAIVASTLAIAALFNPLRRRIQSLIDKRFYRRKYNATQILQAFSIRMRDETDLDTLASDLLHVVEETMQPVHVSLWLREPGGDKVKGDGVKG